MYESTKTYHFLPCAHRQWRDEGHCRWVHGYDRSVKLTFRCKSLDDKGWVMDFGGLKEIKVFLEDKFDHTLLINEDDPEIDFFQQMHQKDLCKLVVLPNVGMEGSAKFIFEWVQKWLERETNDRVSLYSVECMENEKNSAIYKG